MTDFTFSPAAWLPFRDREACEKARRVSRDDITRHPNPDLSIRVLADADFSFRMILDTFERIRDASERDQF